MARTDLLLVGAPPCRWRLYSAFHLLKRLMEQVAMVGWARTRCRPRLLPMAWLSRAGHVAWVRQELAAWLPPATWGPLPPAAIVPWCAPALPADAFLLLFNHSDEELHPELAEAASLLARAALALAARPDCVFERPEELFGEDVSPPNEPDESGPAVWTLVGEIAGHPQWPDGTRVRLTATLEEAADEDDDDAEAADA